MKSIVISLGILIAAIGIADARPIHGGVANPGAPTIVTSTITNFNGVGTGDQDQVSRYDTVGNKLQISSGNILQVNHTFYTYGEDYACGSQYSSNGPYCGVNVYTSTDLVKWQSLGHLFDPTLTYWQTHCSGTPPVQCFRPKMVYNAANHNYVFWLNQGFGEAPAVTDALFVMVCSTPYGGCGSVTEPSGLAHGPTGDFNIFVDPANGNGYIIYRALDGSLNIWIDALNSTYTDSTGTTLATHAGDGTEAPFMWFGQSKYFVGWGLNCGFCSAGVAPVVESATSPMGTYGSQVTLNANGCRSQPRGLDVITGYNGEITYLFSGDQWKGLENEGPANTYFQPLTITSGVVNAFSCNTTVTVPGLIADSTVMPVPSDTYLANFDIASPTFWRMQTFLQSGTTLTSVKMPMGQANKDCVLTFPNPPACAGGLDVDPVVEITTLDGSNNPVTVLGSVTVPRASLSWGQNFVTLNFNLTGLTNGAHYGIVMTYGGSRALPTESIYLGTTNPYPSGVERYSSNSGATWATEANRAWAFTLVP